MKELILFLSLFLPYPLENYRMKYLTFVTETITFKINYLLLILFKGKIQEDNLVNELIL